MNIIETPVADNKGIRLAVQENEVEIGHAFVYVLRNDSREAPFALLEDVFVKEGYRQHGVGSRLVQHAIEVAKHNNCYKIIGTSRYSRASVHAWYERLGFSDYGKEFRIDL